MTYTILFHDHAQETWDTGNPALRQRTQTLRKSGWRVRLSSMGPQVTDVGLIRCTLLDIYCTDRQPDIGELPVIGR